MHTYGGTDQTVRSRVEGSVVEATDYPLHYVILCVVVSVGLGFSIAMYCRSSNEIDSSTYFYQDLNSVEIKVGRNPLDPAVIKAIHHFQEAPFGKTRTSESNSLVILLCMLVLIAIISLMKR